MKTAFETFDMLRVPIKELVGLENYNAMDAGFRALVDERDSLQLALREMLIHDSGCADTGWHIRNSTRPRLFANCCAYCRAFIALTPMSNTWDTRSIPPPDAAEIATTALSATDFFDLEREQKANAVGDGSSVLHEAAAQMSNWTALDFMDFAERYADYVCNFEKRSDHLTAAPPQTEEQL